MFGADTAVEGAQGTVPPIQRRSYAGSLLRLIAWA
jgi:hypothetical protein